MNRRHWIGLIVAVTMLAIGAWYAWGPISILYHKQGIALADRRLEAISEAQIAGTSVDPLSGRKWYSRRVYHCDRLVALGYLFHASYELSNLPKSSFGKHRDAILFSGMKTFPMSRDRYWGISTNDDHMVGSDTYHMVIDVYDLPEFKSQWDNFATTINEPSIADRDVD